MSDTQIIDRTPLPVLPLRDVVVYPHMVIPLFVGREKSMRALELAMEQDKRILLVAQTSPEIDDPAAGRGSRIRERPEAPVANDPVKAGRVLTVEERLSRALGSVLSAGDEYLGREVQR